MWIRLQAALLTLGLVLLSGPVAAQKFEVHEASIEQIAGALARGEVTSVQLVDAYLARIAAYDRSGPKLNSIIVLNPKARAEAARLDQQRAGRRNPGPLYGVPVLIKDNYDTKDLPTTGSSVALASSQPAADAFQVRMLRAAGAIILGKTNMHELAAGITNISSLGGQTLNPYDPSRNPGGSSGGTGAAIAASFAAVGWGSDTCGSIRIPAAHNALFGLRPTKGLSSIAGIIPLSHSQDVGGPLARTVRDLAIALDASIGPDSADRATLHGRPRPFFTESLRADALQGARLGLLLPYFGNPSTEDREVADIVRRAADALKKLGAELVEVAWPELDSLVANTSLINAEFKFDLMDYLASVPDAPVDSLGDILKRGLYHRALEQTFRTRNQVTSRDNDAVRHTRARRDSLHAAVLARLERERLDALVYPAIRRKAVRIGEAQPGGNCQLSASTGMPALSMPAGFSSDGLPVGIELLARRFDDAKLVAYAFAYEQATAPRRPPRSTPPLVNGAAPRPVVASVAAAGVTVRFEFDPIADRLAYTVRARPAVDAVVLQRIVDGKPAAILHRLLGSGNRSDRGSIALAPADREELLAGGWAVTVYRKSGASRSPLRIAARP